MGKLLVEPEVWDWMLAWVEKRVLMQQSLVSGLALAQGQTSRPPAQAAAWVAVLVAFSSQG
jgi:chaperone required for assembly of F1-ATPase